jgi:uncharacterized protein
VSASMRRAALVVVFVLVLAAVVVGGHVYLAQRLVLDPGFSRLGLAAIALLAGALVLHPVAERTFPPRAARALAWVASLWMGFAFLLLMLLIATDGLALVLGAFVDAGGSTSAARVRAVGVLAVALAAGAAGVRAALRGPRVRRVELHLRRWPAALDGFRIVQVSDVHIGPILDRRFAQHVVERCNALAPDLVAITGDLVDGSIERVADEVAPFAALRARHGVWFVTGNHDYYSGASAWAARVEALGIRVLRNARVTIGAGAASFDLAGVEDHHAHLVSATHREDVPGALAGRDPARPVVLLAHDPATFPAAARHGVDLQLSGHTHGGQLWPFAWFVRLATPFVAGVHRRGDSSLYVSRGTGFWGPAMRLRAPAEITEIVLRGVAALSSDCARA